MKRPQEIAQDVQSTATLVELTSIFEGIASLHIAQIKNQVLQSQEFFRELWHIYTQIRVDSAFHFGRSQTEAPVADRELFIVITAEGGFSGDIDQRLIAWMLTQYDNNTQDIIVIGHHGAIQLAQKGVSIKKYFKLPEKDANINVEPLVAEVQKYKSTSVFYQTYVSLMAQDIKRIDLSVVMQEQGLQAGQSDEIINEKNYIFEPSTFAVIDHLERSMLQIALSQVILESKLAQYASRFKAMTSAHQRADDSYNDFNLQFNRAKRYLKDERLKEIINGMRKVGIA